MHIEEGTCIHDVRFITISLSREWMAKILFTLISYIMQDIDARSTLYEHVCQGSVNDT